MNPSTLFCLIVCVMAAFCRADHPQVLVTPGDREAVVHKLESAEWAKAGYAKLRARLDPVIARTAADPTFASSRLFMNWETHWITPLVAQSVSVGGEGRAPIPTPRFGGARNWASDYSRPAKLEDWTPYNDNCGKVFLKHKSGRMEWVDPGLTGRTFETGNEQVMSLAADAAFVYWLTGEEKYAKFAADILTTYMSGFALMQPPRATEPNPGMMSIIGATSFEVIHEGLLFQVSLTYDFVQPYLKAQGIDTVPIENGLRRWAQRVTDGGGREGNWNLNQASIITYAGLALEDDAHYADRHGRQYFIDIVLNADLPAQKGLTRVIEEGLDKQSTLWPEASSYAFGSVGQLVELAGLLSADPAGAKLLANPLLAHSIETQRQIIYPNGLSIGVGDTINVRMNATALELLIASARRAGDTAAEDRLTAFLQREIDGGNYNRSNRTDFLALTKFVDNLKPTPIAPPVPDRTFWFGGLNVLTQQNTAPDPAHALAATLYGTNGAHIHANGMAIELYGKGFILGADPGRGTSYWTPDHRGYYVTPNAHNTVIINGASTYDESKDANKRMTIKAIEPAPGVAAVSPNISFATGVFRYAEPNGEQARTLAVVRTGPNSGFYYDVFRSKTANNSDAFHDYVYHNMAQSVTLTDEQGQTLPLKATNTLAMQKGLLPSYGYYKYERSGEVPKDLHAVFKLNVPQGPAVSMSLWMPGSGGRTVFAVDAPKNNAIRDGIAAPLRDLPMPTLVVRQSGEAWDKPFVAVYEPGSDAEPATVTAVRNLSIADPAAAVTAVEGNGLRVLLLQSESARAMNVESVKFEGAFAAVTGPAGRATELYLGQGKSLSAGDISIRASGDTAVSGDARRDGDAWVVAATGQVTFALPFPTSIHSDLKDDHGVVIHPVEWKISGDPSIRIATFSLTATPSRRIAIDR